MNKKGFFFILDIVFGLIVLVVGLTVLVSFYYQVPQSNQFELYTSDITSFFTSTKVSSINNNVTVDLIESNYISEDDFLSDVLATFCSNSDSYNFNRFVGNMTRQIIAPQYSFSISVLHLNETVCLNASNLGGQMSDEDSSIRTSSRILLYGINDSYDPQGPYIMEVVVW